MKKVLIYFTGFLLIFFLLPAFFTVTPQKEKIQESVANAENSQTQEDLQKESHALQQQEYDYQKYKKRKSRD